MPSTEVELLAAKIYRRGQFHHVVTKKRDSFREVTFFDHTRFSNFKNDAVYREGRIIDKRLRRARSGHERRVKSNMFPGLSRNLKLSPYSITLARMSRGRLRKVRRRF